MRGLDPDLGIGITPRGQCRIQQPQPPAGNIVLRKWLKSYKLADLATFTHIVQSWDTAHKNTELANYSVCTTWGYKSGRFYLLNVFRRKLDFPQLKRAVLDLAEMHKAAIVLIEDKASGQSLLQELRHMGFSKARPVTVPNEEKAMRLHGQTAKFEGGFVLLPEEAPWLNDYIDELISFPNSKHDDQVDSTVNALAYMTVNKPYVDWTDESLQALSNIVNGAYEVHPLARFLSSRGLF